MNSEDIQNVKEFIGSDRKEEKKKDQKKKKDDDD